MTDAHDYRYAPASSPEEKLMPIAAHALMLLSVPSAGVAALVAVVIAYFGRGEDEDDWRASHYEFTIWTFWLSLAAFGLAIVLIVVGIPLILALGLGLIPIIIGGAMLALVGIWVVIRSALGLVYAIRGEAYPRPRNLIV